MPYYTLFILFKKVEQTKYQKLPVMHPPRIAMPNVVANATNCHKACSDGVLPSPGSNMYFLENSANSAVPSLGTIAGNNWYILKHSNYTNNNSDNDTEGDNIT